jgi:biotin carboxyl carrier protein
MRLAKTALSSAYSTMCSKRFARIRSFARRDGMAEEVRTQVPGNIWNVMVKEGDVVSEGGVLFIM